MAGRSLVASHLVLALLMAGGTPSQGTEGDQQGEASDSCAPPGAGGQPAAGAAAAAAAGAAGV